MIVSERHIIIFLGRRYYLQAIKKKRMAPGKTIALGFAIVILVGAILLHLPIASNTGTSIPFINTLFTSTSAVCVTGLIVVDTANAFSVFGRTVIAILIQIGGLGITSIGVAVIALARRKVKMRERLLAKEALNVDSFKGIVSIIKAVIFVTISFELVGMLLSLIVFAKDYPFWDALGISAFHSIASFNNAGFDILGDFQSLANYTDNVLLNLVTAGLIIFGGIGFFVIQDIVEHRSIKKYSLHTKVVLSTTIVLLLGGTIILKLTNDISWLGAFFTSTSARTAGFATYPMGEFTTAGLFAIMILMFIGASPGSTGGGIKTTTFFLLFKGTKSATTKSECTAFKRRIPRDIIYKAFIIVSLALVLVCVSTFLICIAEPDVPFYKILFEVISGFATVGLSTGITPDLCSFSKIILILTMFMGRIGPLTAASLLVIKSKPGITYPSETINIG